MRVFIVSESSIKRYQHLIKEFSLPKKQLKFKCCKVNKKERADKSFKENMDLTNFNHLKIEKKKIQKKMKNIKVLNKN